MRLTLRTLLAYLDDTLSPAEIKEIGQKVAESDAAQELIARIKQITRRRRLTTPQDTGPGARFDPNIVAEYLDNELDNDQVSELEKTCLESDVHLAEIAACHQILTLVLGEPALIPPLAKERMYGLVKGRESRPSRRPVPSETTGLLGEDGDADDTFLLGLPFYRRAPWLRWALPLVGVCLLLAIAVALWQTLSGTRPSREVVSVEKRNPEVNEPNKDANKEPDHGTGKVEEKGKDGKANDSTQKKPTETNSPEKTENKPSGTNPPETTEKKPETNPEITEKKPTNSKTPNDERVEAGSYTAGDMRSPPSVLVQRQNDKDAWKRVKPGDRVSTRDTLVSLPGYASEVRLDSGVRLLLRGQVRDFSLNPLMDYLLDSTVVLHKPAPGFDADLTLERGRLYISNHKDSPAVVRLRFEKEIWDFTLEEPNTEVGLDLLKQYTRDIHWADGEEPRAELYSCLLQGKAKLKINEYNPYPVEAAPGASVFLWENKGQFNPGPFRPPEAWRALWSKVPPANDLANDMGLSLKELSTRIVGNQPLDVVLVEGLQTERLPQRRLAIYSLCALDDVRKLIDILGDEDPTHGFDREAAIFALRRWISRGPNQGNRLYNEKDKTGVLMATMKYRSTDAAVILALLHDFNDDDRKSPETFDLLADYLKSKHVAIAELAWWHLARLAAGVKLPAFNPTAPLEFREKASDEVKKLIKEGKLPPPEAPPAGGPTAPPKPGSGARGHG
jgi:hypothetical protein